MEELRKKWVVPATRIVVKIGSHVLVRDGVELDRGSFVRLVEQMSELITSGKELILVSSGAVALGRKKLSDAEASSRRGRQGVAALQALAALGQSSLIQLYEEEFAYYGIKVAQILLTRDVLSNRSRYLNARRTLARLLALGAIPVTNENDSVASDELKFGDNDNLAALVTALVGADLLVLLSDTGGLYTADPHSDDSAELIKLVRTPDDPAVQYASGPDSQGFRVGTGGMVTKVEAAATASKYGVASVVAYGKQPSVLTDILAGEDVGTLFLPVRDPLPGRKAWIGFGRVPRGRLIVDEGAKRALVEQGRSLLPSGIEAVEDRFEEGDMVSICSPDGQEFARGLCTYASCDVERIKRRRTSEIEDVLGYCIMEEVVHRDDLVILEA